MTDRSETTTTPAKPSSGSTPGERMSTGALLLVMAVTYAWFFSQALPYTT